MDDYEIVIENCNSIDTANIGVKKGCLNIKFGPNGLGKSTIAKAIVSQARDDGTLADLVPFKSRGKADAAQPKVDGIGDISSALVFDEAYVNLFAFQQDEVVKNSFDIFIKTPEYDTAMADIEKLFDGIKKAFADRPEIEQTTKDLKDLRDAFGKPNKDGSIAKSSKVLKAFGSGNKIDNIPDALMPFEMFVKSANPSKWIGWQIKGKEFLELGDTCPYCATELPKPEQKETALAVAKEYDATAISHLNNLKEVIERLGKYFSDGCQENLAKITKAKTELTAPQKSFLSDLKNSIEALIQQLDGLRTISFFSLRDVDEIDKKMPLFKIDLGMIDKLDSDQTRAVTDPINAQLDKLIEQVGNLKGQINKHKAKIKKTIEENQDSINGFLKSAGYKYSVQIISEPDSYKMKLIHEDLSEFVDSASAHLSYGEKNAFALVLFMHQVISEDPDIVILDDPISSFDKNKKFAIIHQLFRRKGSLRDRTTLMLTHDIEPAIDVVKGMAHKFKDPKPSATFLSCRQGEVKETLITSDDIRTFAKICKDILSENIDDVIKAIYLRRHYEILDNVGLEYNLLASLFKGRAVPTLATATENRDMTAQEKTDAETKIKTLIPSFAYDALVQQVGDDEVMKAKFLGTDVGYEKIQLFRIIRGKHQDDIISKFINESYHIENEYVMQLNPHKFESVPEYVVEECSRLLQDA
ncbi:AAA family ATPase [Sneathiella litorea]|uniref:AAA family ATPase n=1 Tax=Sneathiella litorea TaxID=2606216 RepID=A0A6L8W3J3_9PROT|nr:AAA family ATPase [Sneathiella litorea]MZR29665.1 AAA family ATPase [Sneathiella litorea]